MITSARALFRVSWPSDCRTRNSGCAIRHAQARMLQVDRGSAWRSAGGCQCQIGQPHSGPGHGHGHGSLELPGASDSESESDS
eukprot:1258804-Rhodomonas_salina.3